MDEEEYDAIFSFLEYSTYPSASHHKDLKRAATEVCRLYTVDSGAYYTAKKDKESGKIEYLQVPRGVEKNRTNPSSIPFVQRK